jgi:prepilin-type processing-associated H-X9-DG protein
LADTALNVYRCPSEPGSSPTDTSYVMITGPGTLYDGTEATGIRNVTDGTSNTLLLVEAAGCGINWAEPRDLDVEQIALRINNRDGQGIQSRHPGGTNTAFCDGSAHFLSESIDPGTLRRLITIDDGEPVGGF